MYFYFFCEYPAVIKFQGIIFGTVNNSVKFCDLEEPYPLVEICPLCGESENFAFYLTDEFLNSPPPNASVTDLKGGYFLRFFKSEKNGEFRIISQEKFRDATATAFYDNGYKISLDTRTGFYAETLSFSPLSAAFSCGENVNSNLIFACFNCGNRKILNVYGIKESALLFSKEIAEWEISATGFTTTEKIKDVAKHVIICNHAYNASDGTVKETSRKVTANEKFNPENLPVFLLPYAFCEEFLCGGDFTRYLSDGIKENADKLKGYLGEFIGVTTPPLFRDYKEIGLIRKTTERKYSVDYYTFETEDKKINNIIKV